MDEEEIKKNVIRISSAMIDCANELGATSNILMTCCLYIYLAQCGADGISVKEMKKMLQSILLLYVEMLEDEEDKKK